MPISQDTKSKVPMWLGKLLAWKPLVVMGWCHGAAVAWKLIIKSSKLTLSFDLAWEWQKSHTVEICLKSPVIY